CAHGVTPDRTVAGAVAGSPQAARLTASRGLACLRWRMNRRRFLLNTTCITSSLLLGSGSQAADSSFPVVRTPPAKRKFNSPAVEQTIARIKSSIGNQELAWMFENCFPNTLDTTVDFEILEGRPDTYIITGDIDAMWLRDSTAQVWP